MTPIAYLEPANLVNLVSALLKRSGHSYEFIEIYPIQGGGNNQVYKVSTQKREFLLKIYYSSDPKKRDRLKKEYSFVKFCWENGIRNIPEPICCDPQNNFAIYQYICGYKICKKDVHHLVVKAAADFLEDINKKSRAASTSVQLFELASDACLTMEDHFNSVKRRLGKLTCIQGNDNVDYKAKSFIKNQLLPAWEIQSKKIMKTGLKSDVLKGSLIVSPSDFGFHNAIYSKREDTFFFIDFEYAGLDDPVKLICDFFCQPEIPIPINFFEYFVRRVERIMRVKSGYENTVLLLLPLYRIKWCCIILNDFLEADVKRRRFAIGDHDRREKQLNKALIYAHKYL